MSLKPILYVNHDLFKHFVCTILPILIKYKLNISIKFVGVYEDPFLSASATVATIRNIEGLSEIVYVSDDVMVNNNI